jgi:hypothetical protein
MRMTPSNQKQSGKYNQSKEWENENKTGEEFVSAENMAYVSKPKQAVLDKMEEPAPEPAPEPEATVAEEPELKEEPVEQFKKVDYKKRYDDLKRHHDRKLQGMKDEINALKEDMRNNRPQYKPPKSEEDLAAFKEENPDIYAVVESVAHLRASEETKQLQESMKQMQEQLAYAEAERAYAELKTIVPDFEEIRADDDFHAWAEEQPQQIQDWVYKNSTNVQLAARAINLYKADRGMLNQAPAQTPPVQAAAKPDRGADEAVPTTPRREEPTATGERIWKQSEIAALSPAQAEKYMSEIDAAFAEGRILMGQ